jgi:tight adherence protein B
MRMYRLSFTRRTRFQIQELFLFLDPARLFVAQLALMTGGALLAWLGTGTPVAAVPAFFVLGLAPRLLHGALRERRLRRFDEQLPDALLMLAGGLKAGLGMSAALTQMVSEAQPPLQQEFSLVLREQRLGVAHEKSLAGLAQRVPTQTTILVVSAMRIATETGGGLAEMLERTATTIRSRLQMEGKIRALTSQGKLQAWVVGLLPVGLMLILNALEPEAMGVLWHTQLGWATLAVMAFLESLGVRLIRKIVAIDV